MKGKPSPVISVAGLEGERDVRVLTESWVGRADSRLLSSAREAQAENLCPPEVCLQPHHPCLHPPPPAMSRRSSVVIAEDAQHTRSLSRSSSNASSHLSRWSKGPSVATPTGSRRGSLIDHDGHASPRDPYNGHQGHLTPEQLSKLEDFKSELGKLQVYFEGGAREEGGGKGRGRVDDSTLLSVSHLHISLIPPTPHRTGVDHADILPSSSTL